MRPIAVDLFSGCGGLTLGLKQAGFNVIGAVEIDALAVETYKANHKKVVVWKKDIRVLKISEIKRKLKLRKGSLDLLAGCPPCQGFSSLRTYNGGRSVKDLRNDLVFEFLRFVKELKPKAIMMENVPGLAADKRFVAFCKGLDKLGYKYEYRILDAAYYGVPQRRRRMILLGSQFGKIDFAVPNTNLPTVYHAIATLPPAGESGDSLHDYPEKRSDRIMQLIKQIPKNGGSRTSLDVEYQLPCHIRYPEGFKDVYGRMSWDNVAPTITGGCTNPSKGRFLHPEHDRAITLREAALLQTFPCNFFFSLTGGKQRASAMIGNALPPAFIKKHALKIKECLK
jgi:DNA (cytosine-5)-methyltransferase 1